MSDNYRKDSKEYCRREEKSGPTSGAYIRAESKSPGSQTESHTDGLGSARAAPAKGCSRAPSGLPKGSDQSTPQVTRLLPLCAWPRRYRRDLPTGSSSRHLSVAAAARCRATHHAGMDDICFAAAGGGLNCWDALFGLLGQFDIASDFWYWSTIKDNHKIDVHARNAVLVFAIIGALLEVISWCQKAMADKEAPHCPAHQGTRYFSIPFLEDFPQIILLCAIKEQTGKRWTLVASISYWVAASSIAIRLCRYTALVRGSAADEDDAGLGVSLACILFPVAAVLYFVL